MRGPARTEAAERSNRIRGLHRGKISLRLPVTDRAQIRKRNVEVALDVGKRTES